MKLYYVEGSPNCHKVMAVINHLGITVEIVYLDLFRGDLNTPEYLSVNPNGKVPTIVDGSFSLWETNAIMQYFADTVATNTLFPKDLKIRADINRWQCWELAHYNKALGNLAFESVLKPWMKKGEPNQAIMEYEKKNLIVFADVLEKHLSNRNYVVGDDVTLADYSLVLWEGLKDKIPFDWSGYPNIDSYYDRIRKLPCWANKVQASSESRMKNP